LKTTYYTQRNIDESELFINHGRFMNMINKQLVTLQDSINTE